MLPPRRPGHEGRAQHQHRPAPSLGDALRTIRTARGLSLRDVEKATEISNAYLSQLETGKIDKPNPSFLHKLAAAYEVPYVMLMEQAGYMPRVAERSPRRTGEARSLPGAALATMENLSADEAEELMQYLAFLRSRGGKRKIR